MASRCSCEYRTLKRNFSTVFESLSDSVNPTHFAQKLSEVNLVSKDVVASANIMSIPPSQRIQPVITAVHAQIKLHASLYHKFIDVAQQFNTPLAEVLGKFYDMLGVMSGIADQKPLGHELDLDPVKLNELQQGGGSPEQHAEELLVLWQQKDEDPSWEKLARALKQMGEHEMSGKIVEKHVVEKHVHIHSDVCMETSLQTKLCVQLLWPFSHNESLQSLNLGDNHITNQGATALAKLLETNRSIKILNLESNKIADLGVCLIFEALRVNNSIESLNLIWNKITDVGVLALSEVLPINKSLQHLRLCRSFSIHLTDSTCVTEKGVRQLALGLERNTSLKTLMLLRTKHITAEAMKNLRDSADRRGIEVTIK